MRKEPLGSVLIDDGLTVWDSLAICEYISEHYLDGKGWPQEYSDRAIARAVCAEMHSGFSALRSEMPMNCRLNKGLEISGAAQQDVARIMAIWEQYAVTDKNGDLRLFGEFGIADCFFAPVVLRFKTYEIQLTEKAQSYADTVLEHPSLQVWLQAAAQETEVVTINEV